MTALSQAGPSRRRARDEPRPQDRLPEFSRPVNELGDVQPRHQHQVLRAGGGCLMDQRVVGVAVDRLGAGLARALAGGPAASVASTVLLASTSAIVADSCRQTIPRR